MQNIGRKNKIVDYLFWFVLVVFTNPGNILGALGEDSSDGGANVTDLLFVILILCTMVVYKRTIILEDNSFRKLLKLLLIFSLYYIIIISFFVPQFKNVPGYSVFGTLIKIRHGIINIFLVVMVYIFYLRSYVIFFKLFLWSSITVIILFLITVLGGVDIIPVMVSDRGFISINRLMMEEYGLMPILIPMGVVMLVFNFKFKSKYIILLASLLMLLAWILSLIRRELLSTVLLFILAMVLRNFILHKNLIDIKKIIGIGIYLVIIAGIFSITFPKYSNAVVASVEETIYTIKYGRSTVGYKDARLGFGKEALQTKIKANFIIGTGFDNRWRVSEEAGWEASDYPFLAAIAMAGIFGLLFFLPVYIHLGKSVIIDLKYFRKSGLDLTKFEHYTLIIFITYFVFDLMIYVYWFLPVSLFTHGGHKKWYIFLAMIFAARRILYELESENQKIEESKLMNKNTIEPKIKKNGVY